MHQSKGNAIVLLMQQIRCRISIDYLIVSNAILLSFKTTLKPNGYLLLDGHMDIKVTKPANLNFKIANRALEGL